jgi:ethanolamine utilization protein EutM
MALESLGIVETSSVSASLKTLEGVLNEKNIRLVGKQILGDGIVTIFIKGDLGAIKRALSFGTEGLDSKNEFRSSHIIPLPHLELLSKFGIGK